MDMSGWPGLVFSALVGVIGGILTRSAAVRAAIVSTRAAPYEAMAARLARLEDERDRAEKAQDLLRIEADKALDLLRDQADKAHDLLRIERDTERKAMELAWAHERAQLVMAMGNLAHELYQLKATTIEDHPRGAD